MEGLLKRFFSYSFVLLVIMILSACRNEEGERAFVESVEVAELGIQSIALQSGSQGLTLEASTTSQFQAIATLEDSSTLNISDRVEWASSDNSVFGVNASGLVSAGANAASASLSIRIADFEDVQTVSVSTAALTSIAFNSFPSGVSECLEGTALRVDGVYTDRTSNVTELISNWSSASTSVATIDSAGVVDTLDAGTSVISAQYQGQTATQTLTVNDALASLTMSPSSDFDIEANTSRALVITAVEGIASRDVTNIATYTSSDTNAVTISASGVVSAGGTTGSSVISATCGGLVTTPITATVIEPRVPTGIKITYNGSEGIARVDLADSPIQLRAFIEYTVGADLEVTTSDDVEWTLNQTVSGSDPIVDNDGNDKGEIRFSSTGEFEIKVRFDDESDIFDDTIDVVVE